LNDYSFTSAPQLKRDPLGCNQDHMFDRLSRAIERLERLPVLVRGPVTGAALIWLFIGLRGGFIVLPIVALGILYTSETPIADLSLVGATFGLATVGGAVAGLVYDIVGRPLRAVPLGDYLAGVVSVAPYVVFVVMIIRITEHRALLGAPEAGEVFTFAICTLIFGIAFGHSFLRET
jgi:hypothetical protein